MQRWEYCVLAPAPTGPVVVTLTFFRRDGADRQIYRANDYTDGTMRLWPELIAELGLDGWELVGVHMDALYFKRRLQESPPE